MSGAVVLLGPTASGKSALALDAAESSGATILAVDSMQVYRGMDIGTAKPTPDEQRRVRHVGIDLADATEDLTLVSYVAAVDQALADRSSPIVLVAGTGLYLRALLDRLDPPGVWPEVRAAFDLDPDLGSLYQRLVDRDPLAASRIDPGNRRRIVRALEVCVGSGRPFSSFGPGLDAYPPIDIVQIGLRWPRDLLARRIDQRVDAMLAAGLVDEVRGLRELNMSRTARQALGYKELLDYLDGRCTMVEAVTTIKLRTRQFAVRQERWFRRDPRIRWVDMHDDAGADVVEALCR